jgi:restriction system protein
MRYAQAHAVAVTVAAVVLGVLAAGSVAVLLVLVGGRNRSTTASGQALAATDVMTGRQFEEYVARLMRRTGLRQVRVVGGAADLGADILATTRDGRRVVVQCKRYAGSVGSPHVQRLNGTAWTIHGADVTLLVTTGRPTADARAFAARCGIILVDRDALAGWLASNRPPIPSAGRTSAAAPVR